jgi:hypothetical protein
MRGAAARDIFEGTGEGGAARTSMRPIVTFMGGATGGSFGGGAKARDLSEDGRGETARISRAEDLRPFAARSRSINAIILSARGSGSRFFVEG